MANGRSLPPQAYTRETLTSAFNWLQSQPDSVRKAAATPDALVSIYLRAQRYGNTHAVEVDQPVPRSQSFISDLKNLAEGFRQFDDSNGTSVSIASMTAASMTTVAKREKIEVINSAISNSINSATSGGSASNATGSGKNSVSNLPVTSSHAGPSASATSQPPSAANETVISGILTDKTNEFIQDIKTSFNLSTDAEALNMMAAIAYQKLKNLLG
jgi:hypothetical protein